MAGRNKDNTRRVKRASQARYDERQRMLGVPRSEDVSRALLNAVRNHRAQIVNTDAEKRVLAELLAKAADILIDQGFDPKEIKGKLGRIIRSPKPLTIAEKEARNVELRAKSLMPEPGKTISILKAVRVATCMPGDNK